MDAVKFIEERKRLCEMHKGCRECPAFCDDKDSCVFGATTGAEPGVQVKFIEEWSAAHPRKTRQSVFLEQYPEAEIDSSGCLMLCPKLISAAYRGANGGCTITDRSCPDCRREFLMQEVE